MTPSENPPVIPPSDAGGAPTDPVAHRLGQLLALLGWALAIGLALHFFLATKLVVLGLLGAAVLAAAIRPLRDRFPARRWYSAILLGLVPIVVAAGLAVLAGWLLWDVLQQEIQRWPEIQSNINRMLERWAGRVGIEQEVTVQGVGQRVLASLSGPDGDGMLSAAAGWIAGGFVALALVFLGGMFMLGEPRRRLEGGVASLLPPERRSQLSAVVSELDGRLRWWLLGVSVSMTVTGAATWAGLALIGLPFALTLAVFAGLAQIVPNLGPTVAFAVVLLVAATQGGTMVVQALVVWLVVQGIESYVLVPWVMKRAVKLPPLVTLFSVVVWGNVFGLPGLLLAIPLDLVLFSFLRHFLADPAAYSPRAAA